MMLVLHQILQFHGHEEYCETSSESMLMHSRLPVEPKAGAGAAAPNADCVGGVAPNAVGAVLVPPNE